MFFIDGCLVKLTCRGISRFNTGSATNKKRYDNSLGFFTGKLPKNIKITQKTKPNIKQTMAGTVRDLNMTTLDDYMDDFNDIGTDIIYSLSSVAALSGPAQAFLPETSCDRTNP